RTRNADSRSLFYSQLYFFFSSRRRHTRFKCDWSSDVCSSDLRRLEDVLMITITAVIRAKAGHEATMRDALVAVAAHVAANEPERSEERRVGKECRVPGGRGSGGERCSVVDNPEE